jgi:hypothetical protein
MKTNWALIIVTKTNLQWYFTGTRHFKH